MDPRAYGGPRIQVQGQTQAGSRGRQEDLFNQRGKQEDLFAQRGGPEDQYAQRGHPEDQYGASYRRPETDVRIQDESQRRSKQPYGGSTRPIEGGSPRGVVQGGVQNQPYVGPKRPMVEDSQRAGARDSFGEFSFSLEPEPSRPPPVAYSSVSDEAELHPAPGHEHNPALQTMVKMVTMLNFMKVELGETKTLRSKEQWRAAGAEFIGTFLFIYLGCGSVVATGMLDARMTAARLVAIAIAHGLAISFLTGATGAISGGHLNPAVTLAFVVAGKENLVRAGLYVSAQLFGAIFGALFLKASTPACLRGTLGSHDINEDIYTSQGFLMEMVLTFVLVFVIFGVAVDRRGPGVIAPLPIGFAVLVDHLVGVPYTGASMNPARSFGPALVSGAFGRSHLVYWVAPGLGATAAASLYRYAFLEPAEAAARALTSIPTH